MKLVRHRYFWTLCLCILISYGIYAQCPMCKMAAESDLKNGGTAGRGLNAGILYMLCTPYLLLAAFVIYWKKYHHQGDSSDISQE